MDEERDETAKKLNKNEPQTLSSHLLEIHSTMKELDLMESLSHPALYNHSLTGEWAGYRSIAFGGDWRAHYKHETME